MDKYCENCKLTHPDLGDVQVYKNDKLYEAISQDMTRKTYTEEEVFNLEMKAYRAGALDGESLEKRRTNGILTRLMNRYNLESMDVQEYETGKYDAIVKAIQLLEKENND